MPSHLVADEVERGTVAGDRQVLELLQTLVDEVRGLRADLAVPQKSAEPRGFDNIARTALLSVLAASVADKAFSAREMLQHATLVDGSLRAALETAGLSNPRQLGKWLRTIEGRVIDGLRLERLGVDRDGVIWRVWRV